PLDHKGVIVCESFNIAATSAIIPIEQFALFFIEICSQKICGTDCNFQVMRVVERLSGARKRRDHQTVPCSDDLVVEMRARTFTANSKQFLAALREQFRNLLFGFLKMLSGFPVRVTFD